MDLSALRGRFKVLAIKRTVELYPEADAIYGCDSHWWVHVKGLPKFPGRKFTWRGNKLNEYPDIERVDILKLGRDKFSNDMQWEPGLLGSGGNSGFQAVNMVAQWGPRMIVLIGFDMNDKGNLHWYGLNRWAGAGNPNNERFKEWLAAFDKAAPVLKQRGITVANASPASSVKCFPFMTIEEAFATWKNGPSGVGVDRL